MLKFAHGFGSGLDLWGIYGFDLSVFVGLIFGVFVGLSFRVFVDLLWGQTVPWGNVSVRKQNRHRHVYI